MPRTAGPISKFSRGSLWKSAAKGYALIWALDLQMGGHDLLLGRPRRAGRPAPCSGAVVAMGATAELTGARVLLFLSTKRRSKTMGRWRNNPGAHLDGLLETKRSREGPPRRRFAPNSARSKCASAAARAWKERSDGENNTRGRHWRIYRARYGKESRRFRDGKIQLGSVASSRVLPGHGRR